MGMKLAFCVCTCDVYMSMYAALKRFRVVLVVAVVVPCHGLPVPYTECD